MKRFLILAAAACAAVCAIAGCSHETDYSSFISEKRTDIFIYKDDVTDITVYCSEKEQPYAADGYKGNMCGIAEIFVTLPKNPQELEISMQGFEGEMNYQAVENRYYLSFSTPAFTSASISITLTADGKSETYTALSVKNDGIMSCEEAVKSAAEHNRQLFENLTSNGIFNGEIYVRLLYDDGCYYYVGICDKSKHITAYLIDGEHGKVIATKELQG